MRVSKRAQEVSLAQTEMQIMFSDYGEKKNVDDLEIMNLLLLEYRHIVLRNMEVEHAEHHSDLKDAIEAFQTEHKLTDVEVCQAITSWLQSCLKYMLRYERHGNYDKPAMEE